jgi:hypothetical protein
MGRQRRQLATRLRQGPRRLEERHYTILTALVEDLTHDARRQRLEKLGQPFAHAFDEANARSGFIDTEERDELLDGLANFIVAATAADGVDRQDAIDTVLHAVNTARGW